jgi:hypothetical protein
VGRIWGNSLLAELFLREFDVREVFFGPFLILCEELLVFPDLFLEQTKLVLDSRGNTLELVDLEMDWLQFVLLSINKN